MSDHVSDQDAYLERIAELINRYGWAIQGVLGAEEDLAFSYTVGMFLRSTPEFVIFGLAPEVAGAILNELAERAVAGQVFEHGAVLDDVLVGFSVTLVAVADSSEHLNVANRMASDAGLHTPVSAWQVVFPDEQHRWPWQPRSRVAAMPILGEVPPGM